MRSKFLKAFLVVLLLVGLGGSSTNAGVIYRFFYDNIPGTNVSDLINATNAAGNKIFPNGPNKDGSPLQSEIESQWFEGPAPGSGNGANNYGSMMQGFLEAPQTGSFTFWLAASDSAELWLSTDTSPANKVKIASAATPTGNRVWTAQASQKSAAISLVRGQKYYVQVIHKAGVGVDYVSVAWTLPDGTFTGNPIPALYLQPFPVSFFADPQITQQSGDMVVQENAPTTLSINLNASHPVNYQWYKGVSPTPTTLIPDAILSSYTFVPKLSDHVTFYQLLVGAKSGVVLSRVMKVTVTPDTTPPTIASAKATLQNPFIVKVAFSEAVDPATASDIGNYAINNSISIYGAVMDGASGVQLYTDTLTADTVYTLTVNNIKDMASSPNTIAANTTATFSFSSPNVAYNFYGNVSGTATNDILNATSFKNGAYDSQSYFTTLDVPQSSPDLGNFISQLRAILTPPTTGAYTFYVAADDGCMLWLSTDANPANKVMIAGHNYWTNPRTWVYAGTDTTISNNLLFQKSAPITLQAGQKYYIEADSKEGGGGDNLSVAWVKPGQPLLTTADNGSANPLIPAAYLSAPAPYTTLGPISFVSSPTNVTVTEGSSATLRLPLADASISGTGPHSYQWYSNGIALPGATNLTYTISRVLLPDHQGVAFTILAANSFSRAASANAYLTVNADTAKPTATVGSLYTNTVTVIYNKPMVASVVGTAANYSLKSSSGSTVNITGATVVSETTVTLATDNLTVGASYTLTISNAKDQRLSGNVMDTTSFNFISYDAIALVNINNSQNFDATANGTQVTIRAGGADIWGTADQFAYLYAPVTGNFDVRIRIQSISTANDWSKAGLMARLTTDAGSRHVFLLGTPSGGAQKVLSMQYRDVKDQASSDGNHQTVSYPEWLRMARVGSIFYCFWSLDGTSWNLFNQKDTSTSSEGAFPATILLGIAATSHNTGSRTTAVLDSFGPIQGSAVAITTDVTTNYTTLEQRAITLSVGVSGTQPFAFQWQKQAPGTTTWVNISGATGASYTTPVLQLADNGAAFRCNIQNLYGSKTSATSVVTVNPDTVPPVVVSAGSILNSTNIAVRFDENVESVSATTLGNYSIVFSNATVNPATATLRPDGSLIVLGLPLANEINVAKGNIKLVVGGVKDLAGNVHPTTTNALVKVNIFDEDIGSADTNFVVIDPIYRGVAYTSSGTDYEVLAGGSDIWNKADGFHFDYTQVSGDFDVRVRVQDLQYVSDNWAKAGLMVREDTSAASRNLNIVVDPTAGANVWESNYRATKGGDSAGWPGVSAKGPVTYPNAWIRIVRQGNNFAGLRSVDGNNWEVLGSIAPSPAYPTAVFLGLATTAHNNSGTNTLARFRDLQINPGSSITPPTIVGLSAGPSQKTITVTYSIPVDSGTATKTANYALNNGLTISGASIDSTGTKVTLVTSQQTPNTVYTLTINNVYSAQGARIKPNSAAACSGWVLSAGFMIREVWNGISDPLSNLKASPKYPNNPDTVGYLTSFEAPSNVADNYSQRVSGYVIPPVTGDYVFYVCSDDHSELYLSTDDNPANKKLIAQETQWSNPREYTASGGSSDLTAKRSDKFTGTAWPTKDTANGGAKITLTAGNKYYIEALMSEGGGGDNLSATWTLPGVTTPPATGADPIPGANLAVYANPDLSILYFTATPQNTTVVQNRQAVFTANIINGQAAAFFLWQKQAPGSSSWVNAAGTAVSTATSSTFTTARLGLADNGSLYRVIVNVPGDSRNSGSASVTVTQDVTPPQFVSINILKNSSAISVVYSEAMDPASATNPANYLVSGNSVPTIITNATLSADGTVVILSADQPITTKIALFAQDVADLAGNLFSAFMFSTTINMTDSDIGTKDANGKFTDPIAPGYAYALAPDSFDVVAGGSDVWNKADGFHFVYKQVTGDFDVKVRVQSLKYVSDNWAKAGLMVREALTGGSRDLNVVVDPTAGANVWEINYRAATDGDSAGWPNTAAAGPVTYPNAWIRITRVGQVFTGYRSSDGANWTAMGTNSPSPAYPASVYVGMNTSAHNNSVGTYTFAQYRNFSLTGPNGPLMTINRNGDNLIISWPKAEGDNYILESGNNQEGWIAVPEPVVTDGDQNMVTVPAASSLKFYRLVK